MGPMGVGLRSAAVALALTSAGLVNSAAWAGDDGAAPLWQGHWVDFRSGCWIESWLAEKPPPINYREHGKLVLPPNTELPPPGSSATPPTRLGP